MKLFVYGTLMRGECNEERLRGARFIGVDCTPPIYSLVNLGPYPGLIEAGTTAVHGEVYEIDDVLLAALDAFEEHPDVYLRTMIDLESRQSAFAYVLRPEHAAAATPLARGDWRQRPAIEVPWDVGPLHGLK
ncbi:MAG: gamma-glutamylcyclotransferase family protein [Deltaproteobacteria bacterium]|nr:gamma-glutamylcyclotransferase family protein [Deltaproteobacteria bacterium]